MAWTMLDRDAVIAAKSLEKMMTVEFNTSLTGPNPVGGASRAAGANDGALAQLFAGALQKAIASALNESSSRTAASGHSSVGWSREQLADQLQQLAASLLNTSASGGAPPADMPRGAARSGFRPIEFGAGVKTVQPNAAAGMQTATVWDQNGGRFMEISYDPAQLRFERGLSAWDYYVTPEGHRIEAGRVHGGQDYWSYVEQAGLQRRYVDLPDGSRYWDPNQGEIVTHA